jgi:hypothetical protein
VSAVAGKLREARALIERGWCKEAYARGTSGRKVNSQGRSAVCFCAVGAINRVGKYGWDFSPERDLLKRVVGYDPIDWNDAPERTQAEVLAAFDKAIELAEASDAA